MGKKYFISILLVMLILTSCTGIKRISTKDKGSALFTEAEDMFNRGEYSGALLSYRKYLQEYPNSAAAPAALYKSGAIHYALHQYPEARKEYQKIINEYPKSPYVSNSMVEILRTWYMQRDYGKVIQNAKKIPDNRVPNDYILRKYTIQGDAYLETGAFEDAALSFFTALKHSEELEKKIITPRLMNSLSKISSGDLDIMSEKISDQNFRSYIDYQKCLNLKKVSDEEELLKAVNLFIEKYQDFDITEKAEQLKFSLSKSKFNQFKIGCLLPFTGKYKKFGLKAQRGFDLAWAVYSTHKEKHEIEIVYKDTCSNPEKAREAVKELSEEGVAAIIGPVGTVEAAAEEAQLRSIPIITFTGKEDFTKKGSFIFRNFITKKMQVKSLLGYSFQVLGLNNFAILYPDEKYGRKFMNLFWDEVDNYGGKITGVESYNPKATDFLKPIKKLIGTYYEFPEDAENSADEKKAKLDFDAIFIPDSASKAGLILPQLSFYDVGSIYFLGTNLWHSDSIIEMAEANAEQSIIPDAFFIDSKREVVKKFIQQFQMTYDEMPGLIEAIAYDSTTILFNTVSAGTFLNSEDIKNRILETNSFEGVTGITSFDKTGDAVKELNLLQVKNGEFKEIDKR